MFFLEHLKLLSTKKRNELIYSYTKKLEYKKIKYILENYHISDMTLYNCIYLSSKKGYYTLIELFMKYYDYGINSEWLYTASRNGNYNILKYFVNNSNLFENPVKISNAFNSALQSNDKDTIKFLLGYKNYNFYDGCLVTCAHYDLDNSFDLILNDRRIFDCFYFDTVMSILIRKKKKELLTKLIKFDIRYCVNIAGWSKWARKYVKESVDIAINEMLYEMKCLKRLKLPKGPDNLVKNYLIENNRHS
jgi:hypothetical protein